MVLRPPSKWLWAAELPPALWMGATWWRGRALLAAGPRGDGQTVPSVAIWSRSDGLVHGLICGGDHGAPTQVRSSHLWVQHRPEVPAAVARALAGA